MKRFLNSIFIALLMFVLIPVTVLAAGSIKPTTSSLSIRPGGTATFTIKANNATGKVNISSSNTGVANVSASSHWMDNDSFTVTVKGVSEGTATITVSLSDAATYDEEELHGSYSINVKVAAVSNTGGGGYTQAPEVRNDATLSKIEINGYNIDFDKNKTDYSLEVSNDVVELNVNAIPNKSTSKATVNGNTNLKVGENTVKINVTSADGTKKEYIIKVVRKDEIPETDIDNLPNTLKNTTKDTIALRITDNTEISADVLKQVKDSNKNLIINNYSQENKLLYSWTIVISSLEENDKYDFGISFVSEHQDKILKITNYSEMLNVKFNHSGKLPKGTKIKIYVGDRFADNEKLNLYYYNETKGVMELIDKNLNVEKGFVNFELDHCSEYILTRATLADSASSINTFLITTIIEAIVIISLILLFVFKGKNISKVKNKEHNKNEK